MSAAHTPGPWLQDEGDPLVIVNAAGSSLGEMSAGDPFITYEQQYANARLAAAAPALLTVIRTSIGNVRSLGPAGALGRVPMPYQEWMRVLEEAYVKATGERP